MTIAYHMIKNHDLESALTHGLKRTSRGDMGSDGKFVSADKLLDRYRPAPLLDVGVSRDDNLYCYLQDDEQIVDIQDGRHKDPGEILGDSDQCLLRVEVDPLHCYVSDLDLYDEIVEILDKGKHAAARLLVGAYWSKLVPLSEYDHHYGFRRPEIMVTYDVDPSHIRPLQ